ncbi:hypothetical protein [Ottowia sp.]|uniref:hypothetical protein n=1 Tax=Ottowia sp. TaxID=1898956 RepID=UPI001DB52121|nr:hypothetical protein [Ottowia sp.]MBK6867223.1 hypothetical protein [Burkholderiales bacterium]MBK8665420.1 hypothetical protein [Burkholderiales bacterium]HRO24375.1 hypothetical protein [Promineifilum sp.]
MAKIFHPRGTPVFLEASKPHPEGTQYRLSIGEENWDGLMVGVIKVQMVYGGKVSGRRAPSFPLGTDDAYRVMVMISNMVAERGKE